MSNSAEKVPTGEISHVENASNNSNHAWDHEVIKGRDFTQTSDELGGEYFKSMSFIGSVLAVCMTFACGQGGFSLIAPVLGQINADIGPDANITWVALSYLLTTSIGLLIVGRVTDIFGRRWWFTGGSAVGCVGSIVSAVAPNVPALIAGQTLIGIGASVQLSYAFAMGELVPIKYRFLGSAVVFAFVIPFSGVGPAVSYAFIYSTSVGWRGIYYMMIAMNAVATVLFFFFYHPPSFDMKHDPNRKWEFVKNFDYIGCFVFILGLMLMLMGLSWGGVLYPWKSAHVITTIVVGFFLLVGFFLYQMYGNLKEPLLPMSIFKNRGWVITTILWGTGSALYYANAILWPAMVGILYGPGHGWVRNGFLASVPGSGIILGEWTSACLRKYTNVQLMILFPVVGVLLGCMATATPDSVSSSTAIIFLASYFIGWCEMINSTVSTISIDDQREIGTAVGTSGGARSFFSTIGATVFTSVLNNRLARNVPAKVPAALAAAGLNATSIPAFIAAVAVDPTSSFSTIPGINPEIAKAGVRAYQEASAASYRTVFLTTIAFSVISAVLSIWAPNVNHLMTTDVNTPIGETNKKKLEDEHETVAQKV